jgi:hypothetical protein
MITDTIIDFFTNIIVALINLLPNFELPSWHNNILIFWSEIISDLYKLQMFVPITAIFNVFLFIIAMQIAYMGTKIVRIIISNMTGGGGAL